MDFIPEGGKEGELPALELHLLEQNEPEGGKKGGKTCQEWGWTSIPGKCFLPLLLCSKRNVSHAFPASWKSNKSLLVGK